MSISLPLAPSKISSSDDITMYIVYGVSGLILIIILVIIIIVTCIICVKKRKKHSSKFHIIFSYLLNTHVCIHKLTNTNVFHFLFDLITLYIPCSQKYSRIKWK